MQSNQLFSVWRQDITTLPVVSEYLRGSFLAARLNGVDMKPNSKFATALRISKLIPMVLPEFRKKAILALLAELKLAIG